MARHTKAYDLNRVVTVDMETFYSQEYSLRSKELNTSEYVRDPRFIAHCVGIKIGQGKTKVYWYEEIKPALEKIDWTSHGVLCHHTAFDGLILSHHYGIVPAFYYDTLSMARALHGNVLTSASLDAVAAFYGVGNKIPNVLAKMKGWQRIPDDVVEEATKYTIMDVDLTYVLFQHMVQVFPERELRLIDQTVRMFCAPVLRVDIPRAQAELEKEIAEKAAKVEACGFDVDQLQSAGKLASVLRGLGVEPPMKISPRTDQKTFAFSLQDEDFLALAHHPDDRVRAVIDARIAVKSTLGETRAKRFIKAGEGDLRLPVYLNYCGAHTTRWSGGNKLNLQNLPRGGELRKAILAPEDHFIVACDSAQIEARVLAWLAGQADLVEAFKDGRDVYSEFASDIYERPINKKDSPQERFLGKVCILGLGYGMGWRRFRSTLALGLMGPPLEVSEQEAQRIVNLYRGKYPYVKALWRKMENVLQRMIQRRVNGGTSDYVVFRPGVLEYDEQTLWLPNGLPLHYPELSCDFNEETGEMINISYRAGKQHSRTYGAHLVENVVQALARVIVADQLLDISERWRVVTMTHDEVVCVAPKERAEECKTDMLRVMSTPPAWGPDIPLAAEAGFDVCYSK